MPGSGSPYEPSLEELLEEAEIVVTPATEFQAWSGDFMPAAQALRERAMRLEKHGATYNLELQLATELDETAALARVREAAAADGLLGELEQPRELVAELRALRSRFESIPKAGAEAFQAILTIHDELAEWERAVHRWASEYDANLHGLLGITPRVGEDGEIVEPLYNAVDDNEQ